MHAEWSAECSPDDSVLVVPWHDPETHAAFVDLRVNPYDFDRIPEAEHHPPLMQALRALNATRSPVFTAKCDAWAMDCDEVAHLQLELDGAEPHDAPSAGHPSQGFASYIDLLWRDRSIFASFPKHERTLRRLTRLAAPLAHPAALECVLRPAVVDLDGAREGFAVSLYVKSLGADLHSAEVEWAAALTAIVALLRSKDL
ncbi:MAG: hypothetical protein ABR910_14980 [Acidobacteriaceae bacterium]|jgi:hypothetical protein